MDDEYITNMNTTDIDDNEILKKLKKNEEELSKIKTQLDEKNKLCLNQKHKIEDLSIENKDLQEKFNNQKNLLKFYEEKAEKENNAEEETDPEKKDKIKQLEIKIMKLNEKIKELEEAAIKKDNDLEVIKQELEEEKEISQKAAEMIAEKEEEIEELKKNPKGKIPTTRKRKSNELSTEEIATLQEVFLTQQEEYDQYKETSEKKIKAYTEENTKLTNELNELKDKNSSMEIEISRLKEATERLENEKIAYEEIIE